MSIVEELKELANDVKGMQVTVPRIRNRHREFNSSCNNKAAKLLELAERVKALQDACDTNMTLFESLIDMYERGHISINPESRADIQNFAKELFGNMRSLIANYEEAKDASVSEEISE